MPSLLSIQVGLPRADLTNVLSDGRPAEWVSGIVKQTVTEPIFVGRINLAGDGQADLKNHGGPDRPVLAYSANHYPSWKASLGREDVQYGWFGENFTVLDHDEDSVCIGDVYRIGEVVLEVSQPRKPCWKLARRFGIPNLVVQVEQTCRTGWYLRVLEEGVVAPGAEIERLERPYPEWTIRRAHAARREKQIDPESARRLAACKALSQDWKALLSSV